MNTTKAEQIAASIVGDWYDSSLGNVERQKFREKITTALIQYSTEQNKELDSLLRHLRKEILACDYNEHWESFKALEAYLDSHPAALLAQHSEKGEK